MVVGELGVSPRKQQEMTISYCILALSFKALRLALTRVEANSNGGDQNSWHPTSQSCQLNNADCSRYSLDEPNSFHDRGRLEGKMARVRRPKRRRCHNLNEPGDQSQQNPIEAKLRLGREEQLSLSPRSQPSQRRRWAARSPPLTLLRHSRAQRPLLARNC